jgi:hypothetical protein
VLTAVLAVGGLAVHLGVQRLAPAPFLHADERLVGLLPFLPWTIWIYLLFFPFLVVAGVLCPAGRWWRLVAAWAIASVASWALVLLVPVTFSRPETASLGTLHAWIFGLVYGIDAEHVTFPCLHSASTWISWAALRDRGPLLRRSLFVLAVAITLSTMTTRQHLLTDNVAAVAIALLCIATTRPALPRADRVAKVSGGQPAAPGPRS